MASLSSFIVLALLIGLCIKADEEKCHFPTFMYEAPGWDMGIRNEGRSSRFFIIFEDNSMVSIDYKNWHNPDIESLCVTSVGENKVIVSFPSDDTLLYKCIKFVKRSTHVVQLMESEPSLLINVTQCEDINMAINDWLLVWAGTPSEYQNCGLSGGYAIMDIYVPSRDQHFCQELSLPPRIESECQYGEGILINFRYPQCASDVNMPIYEMKFTCLGSWSSYGFTYTVITDGAPFLPRLWLMRFPMNVTGDFYIDFLKDIVADRTVTVNQTLEYLRWRLVRQVFPSLCEDESSDCSDCAEDDGFYCQKTCGKCDAVQAQQRCNFEQSLKGEWLESSWSGTKTTRITSSLLYPAGLSPFECFVIGGPDSLDWLKITGRQTLVSVHKNGCRPRYSCVAINEINPTVIQYRLSQSIVWPHSQNLQAEDICDYNQFQDDNQPLGNTYRSHYEKYLVKNPSGPNRQLSACNLNEDLVFSAVFNGKYADTCVGTLKQCSEDSTRMVLHVPICHNWKSVQTLNCLSSTVEVRQRFIIVEDTDQPSNIYCIVGSTEPNNNRIFFLFASDCNVNILISLQYGHFHHHIARFESVESYNSTTECSTSDITFPGQSERSQTTSQSVSAFQDEFKVNDTETITFAELNVDGNADRSAMPLFSKGYDVTSTEKQFESTPISSIIPEDFTTLSASTESTSFITENNVQREAGEHEVKSGGSIASSKIFMYYFLFKSLTCFLM